ncbi:MAG: outer membrane protein [Acidobacteriota bacterium]
MRGKWTPGIVVVFAVIGLSCAVARGQGQQQAARQQAAQKSAQASSAASDYPETDIGGSFYRAMLSSSTGSGVTQTPQDGTGGMFEVRHLIKPLVGFELSYGVNTENQTITATKTGCGYFCGQSFTDSVIDNFISVDWVFSKQFGRLRPFALAGLGWYIAIPGNSIYGVNDVVRTSLVAGGGVDYSLTNHWGVRGQFRGNFFTAPDLSTNLPSSGAHTQMFQPAGGFFYEF